MPTLLRPTLFLFIAFTIPEATSCWAGESVPEWYEAARKYVEADIRFIDEGNGATSNAIQILQMRGDAFEKLKDLPYPTVQKLNEPIQSTRQEDREAALVTAMALEFHESALIQVLLLNYEKEQSFLAKFYSHNILAALSPSQLKSVEDQLFHVLQSEKDEPIIFTGLQNVARLAREKRIALFVQYMKPGSDSLLRACTVALAQRGKADLEAVKTQLKKLGAKKAVAFLDRYGEATLREVALQNKK